MSKTKQIFEAEEASPEDKKWIEFQSQFNFDLPNRLENSAKYFVLAASTSLTILASGSPKETIILNKSNLIIWILSILISLFVMIPIPMRYNNLNIVSLKKTFKKYVIIKLASLYISIILFIIAIVRIILIDNIK